MRRGTIQGKSEHIQATSELVILKSQELRIRVNNGHEKLNELLKDPFFDHVGELLPARVKAVTNWEAAAEQCRSSNMQTLNNFRVDSEGQDVS
jgi:hypothetical protein